MAVSETKIITKSPDDNGYYIKREQAQKINFAQVREILQRNVAKSNNKSYTQYTKELLRTYIQNPDTNQDTLREISRFVCRNSMLYKKLLMYYAAMPLYYYNITQINDLSKSINTTKSLKDYQNILTRFETFNLKKEMYNAAYLALRDGFYVGYMYETESEGMFLMPLSVEYCRIYGKTAEGEWIVYFNAAYFDSGDNGIYVKGVNDDGIGVWDDCFVTGYNDYKSKGRDFQWFRLTPEKTFCLLSGSEDEFSTPLPFFLPLFQSLLDLLDLETILNSKTELENYKLLVSKIPLLNGEDVDDFAISLSLAEFFNSMLDNAVPDLVGHVISPMDVEAITFESSNKTDNTDGLSQSIQNLFNNAGASQLVVAGGSSTNSIGLKHSIQNDISTMWILVDRMQSWLNYYIKLNISEGYKFEIHKITWYNQEEYQTTKKDILSFGGSVLDYLTACGDSPYIAFQKLNFENTIGIKSLMVPLQTSYTTSGSSSEGGRPKSNVDDLSEEGLKTKEADKNGTENT